MEGTALVVGASSGVGYGCALRFAEEGANVIACARRLEKLKNLVEEAENKSTNGKIVPVTCDISMEQDLDRVVKKTIEEFAIIEILACIAQEGLEHQTHIIGATPELALESYNASPLYTMLLMQKCLPFMKELHYGRIITCSSGSALSGRPGFSSYAMEKGAIMSLTRTAAKEWGQYGITNNCFLPVLKSDGIDLSPQGKAAAEAIVQVCPLGYFGDAYENVSPIVAFMASDYAHYMNGQFISACGCLSIIA